MVVIMDSSFFGDICATAVTTAIVVSLLQLSEELVRRGVFEPKLNRKITHVTIGLVFMLCWPLFSSGRRGAVFAALSIVFSLMKVLLIGLGVWKDEGTVKSLSRYGDHREFLKGPLYYACTITLVCAIYWRTSCIAIAVMCNLCAGDGIADIIGRNFGTQKLPYNRNKSIAGSIAMFIAGFIVSIGFMYYFSIFGYIQVSWKMILGFLIMSLVSTLVESHPLSTDIDDNVTVPLACALIGTFIF